MRTSSWHDREVNRRHEEAAEVRGDVRVEEALEIAHHPDCKQAGHDGGRVVNRNDGDAEERRGVTGLQRGVVRLEQGSSDEGADQRCHAKLLGREVADEDGQEVEDRM